MTGVILAGGRSERFGSDKAFALWKGKPFLQWVHAAVRPVCDSLVVLVPMGADSAKYARIAPGATLIPDRRPGVGPVEALRGAQDFLRAPTVLVAPCDAPGVTTDLARSLVVRSEERGAVVVVDTTEGRLFDLFAAPRLALVGRLAAAKRMEDLVRDAQGLESDLDGLNVNEPAA